MALMFPTPNNLIISILSLRPGLRFIIVFQATGSDQAVGYGLVSLAALIFGYYTLWVVILVSKDDYHFLF